MLRRFAGHKWKLLTYTLFVIGFVDVNYHEISQLLRGVSSPKATSPIHRLVRRTTVEWSTLATEAPIVCEYSANCNQGSCVPAADNVSYCDCDDGYLSLDEEGNPSLIPCDYKQTTALAMFLISFFVGGCGVDWCYAARGDGCYVCLGVLKGLTLGGVAIWWLADWIRILASDFPDGNDVPLYENL